MSTTARLPINNQPINNRRSLLNHKAITSHLLSLFQAGAARIFERNTVLSTPTSLGMTVGFTPVYPVTCFLPLPLHSLPGCIGCSLPFGLGLVPDWATNGHTNQYQPSPTSTDIAGSDSLECACQLGSALDVSVDDLKPPAPTLSSRFEQNERNLRCRPSLRVGRPVQCLPAVCESASCTPSQDLSHRVLPS